MAPTPPQTRSLHLPDADATDALARTCAEGSAPGWTWLLSGPVGAGKSAFSRAFIQHRMRLAGQSVEDVPSPTFTLVQVYDIAGLEHWHSDLYRLSGPDGVMDLGLDEAMASGAICLVEWPDRLGDLTPAEAMHLRFDMAESGRAVTLTGPHLDALDLGSLAA